MSEDIAYRQRRYLISMGVRVVAFLLAVFLFHGIWRFVAAFVALVVPYFAVVFANGGREPDSTATFESFHQDSHVDESAFPVGSSSHELDAARAGDALDGSPGGAAAQGGGGQRDAGTQDAGYWDSGHTDLAGGGNPHRQDAGPEGEPFLSDKQAEPAPQDQAWRLKAT